jgi:hypothetical protein
MSDVMNDPNTTESSDFVFRRLVESFQFLGRERDGLWWAFILGVILAVGVFYVIWMYVRDGRTIGWFWGSFLALLRLAVYSVLAAVFLLPAMQSWSETRTHSKVVVAIDATTSMTQTRDDIPTEAVPYDKLQTRQDKVINFLADTNTAFLKRLMSRNPVTAYRWGLGADEDFRVYQDERWWDRKEWEEFTRSSTSPNRPQGRDITREDWIAWVKPAFTEQPPENASDDERKAFLERQGRLKRLFAGTNVGESALGVLTREINNMVQGVVVFTDGRSTQHSPQAFQDLADRAKRAKIPVFVVAVGEDRQPVRIDIADARGPDATRPEDPFPVSIDVTGEGLAGRETTVYLDIYKPGKKPGKDQPDKVLEKRVTFKANTTPPRAEAEFPITPADFGEVPRPREDGPEEKKDDKKDEKRDEKPASASGKPELAEGDWLFVPRVPKDNAEIFAAREHTREPVVVKVIKRPMRVLVLTSVASREYQFVRTLLVRESDKKRLELSIYLQPIPGQPRRTGIVQDVPPDRMLTRFPDRLDVKDTTDAVYNLASYDVIVAFDPDWTELTKEQAGMVEQWISQQGGGLIVVAGPIHTLELARPGASGVRVGGDPTRLRPILDLYPVILKDARLEKERNTNDPVRLRFPGYNPEMEFLKMDEENPGANALDAWTEFFMGPKGNEGNRVLRGFYGFYPVQKAKDGAITVATFSDPFVQDAAGREQPYLVLQPNYGRGRVVWLGSGEMWRLRQYREVWHERFWIKLARYASQGSVGGSTRRIVLNMGKTFPAGKYAEVQAQMFGRDLKFLPPTSRPKLTLRLPTGVSDKEIPTEYDMKPRQSAGEWEGWFTARFPVYSPGEYQVDAHLPDSNEVRSGKFTVVEVNPELDNTRPDFAALYELASEADDVLARLDDQMKAELRKALQRFKPPEKPGEKSAAADRDKLRLVFDLKTAEMIPECMQTRQNTVRNRGKVEDLWDRGWTMWIDDQGTEQERPAKFSFVLAAVVGLLSIEWLTRKLLRLA